MPLIGTDKSPLRRDLSRKCLGHDLSVLHDEGVGAELEAVVRRLGLPHDIGGIAVNLLPEHLEGYPRLRELLEQADEESPNRLGAAQHAIRCEEPRLGGVVSHGADDIAIAEAVQVVCEYVLGGRSVAISLFHVFLF